VIMTDPILFYTRSGPYGSFTNFSHHGFTLLGKFWKTSEHFFQAAKFFKTDKEWYEKIWDAATPSLAAKRGRRRDKPLYPGWDDVKDDVMRLAVYAKFTSHPDIMEVLLSTGDAEIIEDSPIDSYWGWGKDHAGKNMLGKILMELRDNERERREALSQEI